MVNVTLYTSSATGMLKIKKDQSSLKNLLEAKKIQYLEIDIAADQEAREKMKKASGKTEIPQLFINDKFAGLCDDLLELEEVGQFIDLFRE
eukprot:gene2527-2891_t